MYIKETKSQNIADSLEQLKQLKTNFDQKTNSKNGAADPENPAVDSADSDAFSSLKLTVSQAKQSGRAEYISKLKEAVASGTYDVSSNDLANALIADGAGEFLAS